MRETSIPARWIEPAEIEFSGVFTMEPGYLDLLRFIHTESRIGCLIHQADPYFCLSARITAGKKIKNIFPTSHIEINPPEPWAVEFTLDAISQWCTTHGYEIDIKLGPYIHEQIAGIVGADGGLAADSLRIRPYEEMVYTDLSGDRARLWGGFSRQGRGNYIKAKETGLRFTLEEPAPENLQVFYSLYIKAMQRLKTQTFYFFPIEFFKQLIRVYKNKSRIALVTTPEGVPCASGLWLDVGRDCDAFLAGSDSRFWQMRANNFLFGESIWALKQLDYQRFILGGGLEPLFRFKRSFSKNTIRCNKFESNKISK